MYQKTAGFAFTINALIFFFQALTKSIYPPLILPLREAFGIDNAAAGFLVTLVFFGYALARYPSGVMADKLGCSRTIIMGSLAMAVSFLAVALSQSFFIMAFFTFLLGVSSGLYVTAGYTLAVIIGKKHRASAATAAFETFGMLAGITSPFLVSIFVLYFYWQWLFIVLGVVLFCITLIFGHRLEGAQGLQQVRSAGGMPPYTSCGPSPVRLRELFTEILKPLGMFHDPSIKRFLIWSTLVGGLGAISWTGINAFIPTFLVEQKGYSFENANTMFALIAVSGLTTKIGLGLLADRFGSKRIMFVNLLLSVLAFFALTMANIHWQLLLILISLGATSLNANMLINAYVLKSMPEQNRGAGFGLFSTAYTIIYSLGPYLTGLLSVTVGMSRAIQLSAAGAAAAMLLVVWSDRLLPVQKTS